MDIFHIYLLLKIVMFVSKEENKQKEAGNGPINIKNKNKAIAQWIRSRLRSCGPGFKSQAQQCPLFQIESWCEKDEN